MTNTLPLNLRTVEYYDENTLLEGFLISHSGSPRPTVLISHAWSGLSDFEKAKAQDIADLGYNVFAIDMYGKGIRGTSIEENQKLMGQFMQDRAKLRQRLLAAVTATESFSTTQTDKIAAIGFCFGGLCVLDLARSGANVKGVASFHGMFDAPENLSNNLIKAKVLALHGYDDPLAPPEKVTALANELTDAGVDWQIHAYGLTYHAFTNPAANDPSSGMAYNKLADTRSWATLRQFLAEIFE